MTHRAQIITLRFKPLHHLSNNFGDIGIRCILARDQYNPLQQDIGMFIEKLVSSVRLVRCFIDMESLDTVSVKGFSTKWTGAGIEGAQTTLISQLFEYNRRVTRKYGDDAHQTEDVTAGNGMW